VLPTVDLVGLAVTRVTSTELVDHLFQSLDRREGGWIITANVDHLQRHAANMDIVNLYQAADLVVADGAPLVWASRLLGTPLPGRVAGSDLVWSIAERAAKTANSIYLLGGAPGAAQGAARRFQECFPEIMIAGTSSPSVSDPPTREDVDTIRRILKATQPAIVYVALGSPKQERLIAALRSTLPSAWWVGVGVSLSFVAGHVSRAPIWIQRFGLEWLYRMLQEPRKLMKRYLFNNLPFALRLLGHSLVIRLRNPGRPR
jgi:N-acetylglucosaminyldiphosphoundecaprenol N-acetyl-beta-D-mannosaminyltransferase